MTERLRVTVRGWLGPETPLQPWHVVIFALQCVFLFVSYQHHDIGHTGGAGFVWLSGHVADFYDACKVTAGLHNYLPSTTLVFALWDLPLWLLGVVKAPELFTGPINFWFKLLPTAVMFGCAPVLFAIGKELGLGQQGSRHLVALWLTSPIALFSQFIFGQYDVFTVFCFLCATLFYLRGRLWWFAVLGGVAFSFKYFPVFPFVPMVLVAEKRLSRILPLGLVFAAPAVLESLPFLRSPAFKQGVLGFGAATRPMQLTEVGGVWLNLLLVGWLSLCVFAWQLEPREGAARGRWAMHLGLSASAVMFASVLWNPQWLIFLTPLMAVVAMQQRALRLYLLLDLAGLVAYLGFTGGILPRNVDFTLAANGVWHGVLGTLRNADHAWLLRDVFPGNPWNYFSVFLVVLLAWVASAWPRGDSAEQATVSMAGAPILDGDLGLFGLRAFALVPLFVLPTMLAYGVPALRTYPDPSAAGQATKPTLVDVVAASVGEGEARLELGELEPSEGVKMSQVPGGIRLAYGGSDPSVTATAVTPCAASEECTLELDVALSSPDVFQVFVSAGSQSFSEQSSVQVRLEVPPTRVRLSLPHTQEPLNIRIDPATRAGEAFLSRAVVTRTPREQAN